MNNQKKCLHCQENFDKIKSEFCCNGCKTAYQIIKDNGFDRYYKNLIIDAEQKSIIPDKQNIKTGVSSFAEIENGEYIIYLMIDNIHCGSCVWLIEEILKKQKFVTYARINMSTRRLVLKWSGRQEYGDELVEVINSIGYRSNVYNPILLENYDKKEQKELLKLIAISGFASVNIMLFSISLWSDLDNSMGKNTSYFFHYISMIIALPVILYTGKVFFKSAISVLRKFKTNMDVPISLAIFLTTCMSIIETFNHGEYIYFESAVMLIFFLLIGRYLDKTTKNNAKSIASSLLSLISGTALIVEKDNSHKIIPVSDVKPDMIISITTGAKIPVDGIIVDGDTKIDSSIITGETKPERMKVGQQVFAGTINLKNPIKIKSLKKSDNNLINQIAKLIEDSEQSGNKFVKIADRVAKLYIPIVHTLSFIAFLYWYFVQGYDWQHSLMISVTVLIITCPCALALAVPIVQTLASNLLMKKGIILKSSDALEKLTNIDQIFFDKTGTLTTGKLSLINEIDENNLKLAASMASKSSHPISKSLFNSYDGEIIDLEVEEMSGMGLKSEYQGDQILFGNAKLCNISIINDDDNTVTYLKISNNEPIKFKFSDKVRINTKEIINDLKKMRYGLEILSGDNIPVVSKVAEDINIKDYKSNYSPIDKANYINDNDYSLMVGDGLNDAAALSKAYVSMSPSSALDITQNTADIIYQGDSLKPILDTIIIAKKSMKLIKQNLTISFIYNIIAVPIAFLGFASPLIAAIAMSLSSLIVILNSLRLKRL